MTSSYFDSHVLPRLSFLLIFGAMVIALPLVASAQVGFDNMDGGTNRLSFSATLDDSILGPGDMFGVRDRSTIVNGFGLPFAISDDSVVAAAGNSVFAFDNQGIFGAAKTDKFFGAVDLRNSNNPAGIAFATWTFDIAGFSGLGLKVDVGAMGDFEGPESSALDDIYEFIAQVDGGPAQTLLDFRVNAAGLKQYRAMDNGNQFFKSDPLTEQTSGVELDKSDPNTGALDQFIRSIAGTGSVLTITFGRQGDGGSEAFAFDNLIIEDSTPLFDLDIKPGSDPNSINLGSMGVQPMAILSTAGFDATQIDPSTVLFGNAGGGRIGPQSSGQEDVNGDGLVDLTLKFDTQDLVSSGALDGTTLEGLVTGSTFGGDLFKGSDSVRIVPPGDANNDQIVSAADYTIWANGFGTPGPALSDGDFNEDNKVNAADYTTWANNFGTDYSGSGSQGAVASVPEPSTFLLTCFGLVGLIAYGWRRRK